MNKNLKILLSVTLKVKLAPELQEPLIGCILGTEGTYLAQGIWEPDSRYVPNMGNANCHIVGSCE